MFWTIGAQHFKESGGGDSTHYFLLFLWFQFFSQNIIVKQSSWRKNNWAGLWMGWPHHYEGVNVIYFLGKKEGEYDEDIS